MALKYSLVDMKSYARPVEAIPSGLFVVDRMLLREIGGFPRGRVIEVFGEPAGGKTYLCLKIAASAQKMGITPVWFDIERVMDSRGLQWAEKQGVDSGNFLIPAIAGSGDRKVSIPYAEDNLAAIRELAESGDHPLIILDSISALRPKSWTDEKKDYGEKGGMTGSLAKVMSQALVEICAAADIGNSCVIFINQTRDKMGNMFLGNTFTTSGGNALSFYASLRLYVTRKKTITDDTGLIGNLSGIRVMKSKISTPYISTGEKYGIPDMRVYYDGREPNEKSDILIAAINSNIVEQNGPMYAFDGVKAKGKDAFIEALSGEQWVALCESLASAAPIPEDEEETE